MRSHASTQRSVPPQLHLILTTVDDPVIPRDSSAGSSRGELPLPLVDLLRESFIRTEEGLEVIARTVGVDFATLDKVDERITSSVPLGRVAHRDKSYITVAVSASPQRGGGFRVRVDVVTGERTAFGSGDASSVSGVFSGALPRLNEDVVAAAADDADPADDDECDDSLDTLTGASKARSVAKYQTTGLQFSGHRTRSMFWLVAAMYVAGFLFVGVAVAVGVVAILSSEHFVKTSARMHILGLASTTSIHVSNAAIGTERLLSEGLPADIHDLVMSSRISTPGETPWPKRLAETAELVDDTVGLIVTGDGGKFEPIRGVSSPKLRNLVLGDPTLELIRLDVDPGVIVRVRSNLVDAVRLQHSLTSQAWNAWQLCNASGSLRGDCRPASPKLGLEHDLAVAVEEHDPLRPHG
jgi:hypothetical protein